MLHLKKKEKSNFLSLYMSTEVILALKKTLELKGAEGLAVISVLYCKNLQDPATAINTTTSKKLMNPYLSPQNVQNWLLLKSDGTLCFNPKN